MIVLYVCERCTLGCLLKAEYRERCSMPRHCPFERRLAWNRRHPGEGE